MFFNDPMFWFVAGPFLLVFIIIGFRQNRKKLKAREICSACGKRYQGIRLDCECTNWGLPSIKQLGE